MAESPQAIPIRPPMPGREEFDRLVKRANDGDAKANRELARVLDSCPKIWKSLGDLSAVAGTSFLRVASGGNRLIAGSISRCVRELRKELEGPAPTRLEQLAIERVLLAWVQTNYVNTVVMSLQNVSPGTSTAWHKRQRQSSSELDKSLKSLATLRKLLPAAERSPGKARRA